MTSTVDPEQPITDEVRLAWAGAAREVLVGTAGRYHQTMTRAQVAAHVQTATGLSTSKKPYGWIGGVLDLVSAECARVEEPDLASLCVDATGSVGAAYAARLGTHADADQHAARERLECYRHFGATMPAGGGVAALTPQLSESRSRQRRATLAARPLETCPRCFMVLPAQGGCDSCD